jgi:carboxylesterase type B
MILLALVISLLASLVTAGGSNGNPPIVNLGYVKYQGWVNETSGIKYFQGMRFAQAPIGELRWRAPVPIEYDPRFTGQTLNATAEGAVCMQGFPVYGAKSLYNDLPASEDCLFADVLAPVNPVSDLIPVIVHIHGGGYTEGYNGYASRGEALVNRSNGNVLYVELQYRLGLYGFLGGGAIAQNGDRNTGLLDQRAGLDWIQRHISRFGGDPDKVMITGTILCPEIADTNSGLSAGAGSVAYQMIAGGGYDQPPFRAVYSQSPWWQVLLNDSS